MFQDKVEKIKNLPPKIADKKMIFHSYIRDHSFSTYGKFPQKLTFLTP